MGKIILLSAVATLGIVFQNTIKTHAWIFYLLMVAYFLLVKEQKDLKKLIAGFSLGLLLSIGIWELTGVLMKWTGSLGVGMSIATFIGIMLVLLLEKIPFFNMPSAFFIGLIAYYGLAQPPSFIVVGEILTPALLGLCTAFLMVKIERLKQVT